MMDDADVARWGSLAAVQSVGKRRLTHGRPFVLMCNTAIALGILASLGGVLIAKHSEIGFLVGAVLCGIAEAHGRCGRSHIGMTAPFAGFAPGIWVKCVSAYTLGGLATSYLVGLAVAGLGTLMAFAMGPLVLFIGAGAIGVLMLLREFGMISFNPPQCDLQTHKTWAEEFGLVTGAGMWGAHIGLAVTTVITHGGLYALLLIALASGLGKGEWTLVAFWFGRVVTLWLTPFLTDRTNDGVRIFEALSQAVPAFRASALCGMAILCSTCAVVSIVLLGSTG